MASSRHLVAASVVEEYTRLLTKRAAELKIVNPATGDVAYRPLIDEPARDRVHAVVHDSVAAGARLMAGVRTTTSSIADVPLSSGPTKRRSSDPLHQSSRLPTSTRPHGSPPEPNRPSRLLH